ICGHIESDSRLISKVPIQRSAISFSLRHCPMGKPVVNRCETCRVWQRRVCSCLVALQCLATSGNHTGRQTRRGNGDKWKSVNAVVRTCQHRTALGKEVTARESSSVVSAS